ncbi:MAG: S8 family serine peptidase [Bacteroidetes bacterium]|nr:S8 family serine peptidase [Bacteroidota bacterium]
MIRVVLIAFLIVSSLGMKPDEDARPASEQEKVWVFLTDKDTAGYNPYTFLDPLAIQRRIENDVPVFDISDVPVQEQYLISVNGITGNIRAVSRWFNAVCCLATGSEISQLKSLPFVKDVKVVERPLNQQFMTSVMVEDKKGDFVPDEDQIEFLKAQIERMEGQVFIKNKIDAKGIRVAIFDVGFKSYKTNPAFEHIRAASHIIKTWDFVKNKENVDDGGTHGTFVMSCVGGKIEGQNIGLATGAEFLLARTETWTEYFSEEENWLAAAEWADKNGAHVINSSLGYTYHRYFREDMDGHHSLVAKAANMAAGKGILVVNSAGNEGSNNWKFIGTPADADSVLSVGGIKPTSGIHTSFSSFGPTRDKRLKPNVTAYGHVIGSGPKGLSETQGTSFSGPLVAGFVACARQTRSGFKTMQLFREIEKSGDLFPYYDYAHGYGVPQASFFFKMPVKEAATFEFKSTADRVYIKPFKVTDKRENFLQDTSSGDKIGDRYTQWPEYVFYHIADLNGYIHKYFVVDPYGSFNENLKYLIDDSSPFAGEGPLVVKKSDYHPPFVLQVFYKGYVEEILVK